MRGRWLAGCVLGLAAGGALGQEAPPPQGIPPPPEIPPPQEKWTLQVEPTVWYGAPAGKLTLPGSPAVVQPTMIDQINLDSPRLSPGGRLTMYSDEWRFMVGGYRLEEENRGTIAAGAGQIGPVAFVSGDALTASLNFTEFEAAVMKKIELPDSINGKGGKDFAARLDVLGGMRFYDVNFDFAGPAGSTSADQFFAHPVIGVKLTMEVIERFTIDAQVDLGGFGSSGDSFSYGYNVMTGFIWRPTENIGVQIGYRDMAYMLRSGPVGDRFEYRGAVQGLYFGGVVRF